MNKLYYWSDYYRRYFIVNQIIVAYKMYFKVIKPENFNYLRFKNYLLQVYSRTKKRFINVDEVTVSFKINNRSFIKYHKNDFSRIKISRNYLPYLQK